MTFVAPTVAFYLAQAASGVWFWLILLVALLLAAGGVVAWVRRRLSPHEDFHGEGFTLGDIRRLHKEGKLTDEEYDRAKAGLIATAQATQTRNEQEKKNLKEWGWDTKPPD